MPTGLRSPCLGLWRRSVQLWDGNRVDHADGRALTVASGAIEDVAGTRRLDVHDSSVKSASSGALPDRIRMGGTPRRSLNAAGRRALIDLAGRHRLFTVLLIAGAL